MISGISTAIKLKKTDVKIIGVEPTGAAAILRSVQQNAVVHLDKVDIIAEGLGAPFVGEYTLAHVKRYVDDLVLVSDREIIRALRLILERGKILTEPAGAARFAALLFKKVDVPSGAQVVCVLSGGNIDLKRLKDLL
ncbi:pyridoxal-phosphate dependent enzyme [Candidatus Bathyarchaeota archaeon]|nr:pyridoxal-phosphate dependent enzyme [Candidatus Bathyarchaeota archaeon]